MSNESDSGVELDGARAWCHVIYGLHALAVIVGVTGAATVAGAFVFGVPSLLAVVLNYLKRGEVRGTWLDSHYRWQIRTFWFTFLWLLVYGLLIVTIIGIPFAWLLIVMLGLWVAYRVIRGWLALAGRRPVGDA
ncbi:MAG: hypothetical protein IPK44_18675 [Candidatus Accumulibacter sp.]|uniref:DUF4870 family protein n=1 Tax=Candidatus Accumulibacter TaxID=327159 RepID=UPI001AD003E0|nr:hypothetical protein [Accumulibacter sp.]MBK8116371.1 hypothetical protein [Accumulibacter sp.]MBK8384622.1 hypothetical protein [Accumulibacter sp.]MBK8578900.1 hypothetical protein [Candidatus Accumulibacter propinquus]MBN8436666.1 hypothetical protein [Accumulibacter sp.]